eukprot:gene29595-17908_t
MPGACRNRSVFIVVKKAGGQAEAENGGGPRSLWQAALAIPVTAFCAFAPALSLRKGHEEPALGLAQSRQQHSDSDIVAEAAAAVPVDEAATAQLRHGLEDSSSVKVGVPALRCPADKNPHVIAAAAVAVPVDEAATARLRHGLEDSSSVENPLVIAAEAAEAAVAVSVDEAATARLRHGLEDSSCVENPHVIAAEAAEAAVAVSVDEAATAGLRQGLGDSSSVENPHVIAAVAAAVAVSVDEAATARLRHGLEDSSCVENPRVIAAVAAAVAVSVDEAATARLRHGLKDSSSVENPHVIVAGAVAVSVDEAATARLRQGLGDSSSVEESVPSLPCPADENPLVIAAAEAAVAVSADEAATARLRHGLEDSSCVETPHVIAAAAAVAVSVDEAATARLRHGLGDNSSVEAAVLAPASNKERWSKSKLSAPTWFWKQWRHVAILMQHRAWWFNNMGSVPVEFALQGQQLSGSKIWLMTVWVILGLFLLTIAFAASGLSYGGFITLICFGLLAIMALTPVTNALSMWTIPEEQRPMSQAILTVSQRALGDLPSTPIIGAVQTAVNNWRSSMLVATYVMALAVILYFLGWLFSKHHLVPEDFSPKAQGGGARVPETSRNGTLSQVQLPVSFDLHNVDDVESSQNATRLSDRSLVFG